MAEDATQLVEHVADIVAAYLSNNTVPADQLPSLIASVHAGLIGAGEPKQAAATPAVDPKRSVKSDHIVCLEDGKRFKSLKRHLGTHHGMTPDEYRVKWGLGKDYPMVAPSYAERRSELAKASGLGRKSPAKRNGRTKRG